MPLNRDCVGRDYPSDGVYEVSREKIRDFAAAIGDPNPLYVDPDAARAAGHRDVVAPPTFLTVLSFRFSAAGPTADPELGLDYSRIVHGEQRFTLHRPVVAGDRLVSTTTIDEIRAIRDNEMLRTRVEVTADSGEPVATMRMAIVSRGTGPAPGGT